MYSTTKLIYLLSTLYFKVNGFLNTYTHPYFCTSLGHETLIQNCNTHECSMRLLQVWGFVLLDCMVLGFLNQNKEKSETKQIRLVLYVWTLQQALDINMEGDDKIAKPLST